MSRPTPMLSPAAAVSVDLDTMQEALRRLGLPSAGKLRGTVWIDPAGELVVVQDSQEPPNGTRCWGVAISTRRRRSAILTHRLGSTWETTEWFRTHRNGLEPTGSWASPTTVHDRQGVEFMVHPGEWEGLPEYYGESFTLDEQPYFYGLRATMRLGGPSATKDLSVTSLLHVAWHLWRATELAVGSSLTISPVDQESEMVVARRGGAVLLSGENAKGAWSFSLPEASFVAVVGDLVGALSNLVSMRVPIVLAHPTLTWLRARENVT